jgi:hypothetical protein
MLTPEPVVQKSNILAILKKAAKDIAVIINPLSEVL